MKKILILGGYGFLGKNLSKVFLKDDSYQIFIESRQSGCNILDFNQLKEQKKHPIPGKPGEFMKYKMDMKNMKTFEERDYMDALSYIGVLPE